MLSTSDLVAFVPSTDLTRSRAFYEGTLGLNCLEVSQYAGVLECGGASVRVTKVEHLDPADHTILGWRVDDIAAQVDDLITAGITMTR